MAAKSERAKKNQKMYHKVFMRKYRENQRALKNLSQWDKEIETIRESMLSNSFRSSLNTKAKYTVAD